MPESSPVGPAPENRSTLAALVFPLPAEPSDAERVEITDRLNGMAAQLRLVLAELPSVIARTPSLETQAPEVSQQFRQYLVSLHAIVREMERFFGDSPQPAEVAAFLAEYWRSADQFPAV